MRKPIFLLLTLIFVWLGSAPTLWAGIPENNVVIDNPTLPNPANSGLYANTAPVSAATFFPVLPLNAEPDTPPQLLPITSNHPLNGDHSDITRAVIAIHDISRDTSSLLASLTALAGPNNKTTLVIAPQFLLQSDILGLGDQLPNRGQNLVRWGLDAWVDGADSLSAPPQRGISSFTVLDLLILYLGSKQSFPNLNEIVVAGHGAGADFVLRYAATGQGPDLVDTSRLSVRFLAANPSSFVYFTPMRPFANKPGFGLPDAGQCATYDSYRYGINDLNSYAKRTGANAIRLRYPSRFVTYLTGEKVATDDHYPDTSCAALLEGANRAMRMMNYNLYLNTIYGENAARTQTFDSVPMAGYDAAAMFGSRCGLSVLFGDGRCEAPPSTLVKIPQ